MIRTMPRAQFSYRTRMGLVNPASFNPASAAIGAGVGLATAAVGDWLNSIQLSHDADTATTLIVNGLAEQLSNLVAAYQSEPNPSCADQRAALDAYDSAWAWLQSPQACGAPMYGAAGNRCISDRAPGGKFPWKTYYRDPIANDPRLAGRCDTGLTVFLPTVQTGQYANTGITSTGGSSATGQTAIAPAPSSGPAPYYPAFMPAAAGIPTAYLVAAAIAAAAFALVK